MKAKENFVKNFNKILSMRNLIFAQTFLVLTV